MPADRLSLLRAVPIFAPLPEATLERLASGLETIALSAGETIFRQGDKGDRFYVIHEGSVEVQADGRPPAELGEGEFFGEIALLRDIPRTATVSARTDVNLYALHREAFTSAVTGFTPSRVAADKVIGARLGPAAAGLLRA